MLFDPARTHVQRLDNGLTALVREDRSAPVVAIVTYVRAGYFDEPDECIGISHVLEHMYFKGTPTRGAGEIARATKAAGGFLNAGTIYDRTSYYTVLPSSSFAAGLEIQADAFRNSVIDADALTKELRVIIQEVKRKRDDPDAVAQESMFELLFDRHRMRRWRIGTESALAGYSRDDVVAFYRRHYTAANVVLTVAGDVDVAHAFRAIEQQYGELAPGSVPRDRGPAEPERRGFRVRAIDGDIVQTHLEWGWRTCGTLHAAAPALDMLALVLGQGRASRLYRSTRDTGLAHAISAYHYTPTEIGVFGVSAELVPDNALRVLAAIAHDVERLRETRVTDAELERARNIIDARLVRRFETMEGQANVLAEWQALGDWRLAERYHERLLTTSADELRDAAARYLADDLGAALIYQPRGATSVSLGAADTVREQVFGRSGADPAPPATAAAEPASLRAAPRVVPERVQRNGDVHVYVAPNGVRIVVQPRRRVPLVSLAVSFRGATLAETVAEAGLSSLLARSSIRGTALRSGARLAADTEALGGTISPSAGADLLEWDLNVPSRHFDEAVGLLAEAVLEPTFPETEVLREREFVLQDMRQLRDDMYRYPLRLFSQAAFADHPYGYPLGATELAVASFDREQVIDWHYHEVLRGEPWIFIVGDVDADTAAAAVATRFAALRPSEREPATLPPPWPDAPRLELETRDKAQTAIVVGFPGPARGSDDAYVLQLFANVIGGLGGRLFEELRSRRSLAYSVSVFPLARWLAGAFLGYIATSPEREDEARSGMIDELARCLEEPLPDEDVERAKRYTLGTWRIRGQTNGAHVSELVGALLLGRGLTEIRDFEQRIEAITPAIIQQTARRYLDPARAIAAVVRGTT
jgi:zinc protease